MCKALGRWISQGFWKGLCRILKDCGFVRIGMDSGFWILEGPGREVGWILVSFEKSLESDYSREF